MMCKSDDKTNQRLNTFRELLPCIGNLYCRTYDASWSQPSNAPDKILKDEESLFHNFFLSCGFHERITEYARVEDAPYAVGTYNGLSWYAVLEKAHGELTQIHLLGPVLHTFLDINETDNFFKEYEKKGMSFHSRHLFLKAMQGLPVVFHNQFDQLALMLHFCVNGKYLPADSLNSLVDSGLDEIKATAPFLYRDIYTRLNGITDSLRKGILLTEAQSPHVLRAMLPTNAACISVPLRQMKDTLILLAFQFSNASIEGGVSPEAAYPLADKYIHAAESERSAMELNALCKSLYTDFLKLVQDAQTRARHYSSEIEDCILYIHQHPEEDLSLPALAANCGYGAYYLSRKFKAETNMSLPDYVRRQKIQYAAMLLHTTNDSISAIAERLHYSTYSHFSAVFHEVMGVTPTQYRKTLVEK